MSEMRLLSDILSDNFHRFLNFEVFSIWNTRHAENRRQYVVQRVIKDWFPWFYWFMLIYSFVGLVNQLSQFVRAKIIKSRPLSMWRARAFFGVRDSVIRQLRILGSFCMIACWTLLFYGLLLQKPRFMTPWLVIGSPVVALDFSIWTMEVIFGCDRFSWQTMISFALLSLCQIVMANLKKLLEEPNHNLFGL